MAILQVKMRGETFLLGEWAPVKGTSNPSNWVRRLTPYDRISCIGLMVSYSGEQDPNFHWAPMFHGPILHDLCDVYYDFYPSPQPYVDQKTGTCYSCLSKTLLTFRDHQLQEAKDHLDQFIERFNSLKVFL